MCMSSRHWLSKTTVRFRRKFFLHWGLRISLISRSNCGTRSGQITRYWFSASSQKIADFLLKQQKDKSIKPFIRVSSTFLIYGFLWSYCQSLITVNVRRFNDWWILNWRGFGRMLSLFNRDRATQISFKVKGGRIVSKHAHPDEMSTASQKWRCVHVFYSLW